MVQERFRGTYGSPRVTAELRLGLQRVVNHTRVERGSLWVQDIAQRRNAQGWVYLAVVIDPWSRRVVGGSIADHLGTELVVDALEMAPTAALSRRHDRPLSTPAANTRRGCSAVSATPGYSARWAPSATPWPGPRRRRVLLRLIAVQLLNRGRWATRTGLSRATFEWIEVLYNPTRLQLTLGYLSPIGYEAAHAA